MSKRYARLYQDGSLSVCPEGHDLKRATAELSGSNDDDDTELVQVELKVIQIFGMPKMQLITEHSAICPTCHTEVFVEVPVPNPMVTDIDS